MPKKNIKEIITNLKEDVEIRYLYLESSKKMDLAYIEYTDLTDAIIEEAESGFEFILSTLDSFINDAINFAELRFVLKTFLKYRAQITRSSWVSPTDNPYFPLNQACLYVATTLADIDDEIILRVLLPDEREIVGAPAFQGQSLADLTEDVDCYGNRCLHLQNYRAGTHGRLLYIPGLYEYAVANTSSIFPILSSTSDEREFKLTSYELLKLKYSNAYSNVLFDKLESLHIIKHGLNNLGAQLELFANELSAASVLGSGTELQANLETALPAIYKFHSEVWSKLSNSMLHHAHNEVESIDTNSKLVKHLTLTSFGPSGITLEGYLLPLFMGHTKVEPILTMEQRETFTRNNLIPCLSIISNGIKEFLAQYPEIYQVLWDHTNISLDDEEVITRQKLQDLLFIVKSDLDLPLRTPSIIEIEENQNYIKKYKSLISLTKHLKKIKGENDIDRLKMLIAINSISKYEFKFALNYILELSPNLVEVSVLETEASSTADNVSDIIREFGMHIIIDTIIKNSNDFSCLQNKICTALTEQNCLWSVFESELRENLNFGILVDLMKMLHPSSRLDFLRSMVGKELNQRIFNTSMSNLGYVFYALTQEERVSYLIEVISIEQLKQLNKEQLSGITWMFFNREHAQYLVHTIGLEYFNANVLRYIGHDRNPSDVPLSHTEFFSQFGDISTAYPSIEADEEPTAANVNPR